MSASYVSPPSAPSFTASRLLSTGFVFEAGPRGVKGGRGPMRLTAAEGSTGGSFLDEALEGGGDACTCMHCRLNTLCFASQLASSVLKMLHGK